MSEPSRYERLRGQFLRYAVHEVDCEVSAPPFECTCGLARIVAKLEAAGIEHECPTCGGHR